MDRIFCQITWTWRDFADAFESRFGRSPAEGELSACLRSLPAKILEDRSVEFGWDLILGAVEGGAAEFSGAEK